MQLRKLYISLAFSFAFLMGYFVSSAQAGFDKEAYYAAFASGEIAAMDAQIKKAATLSGTDRNAFEGAMLMRKAGFQSGPFEKLTMFKEGGKKLEAAIKAAPNNVEYRFLRLMIQENAPKIVGYDDNIKVDSESVKTNLKSLPPATQAAIGRYAKKSKYL